MVGYCKALRATLQPSGREICCFILQAQSRS